MSAETLPAAPPAPDQAAPDQAELDQAEPDQAEPPAPDPAEAPAPAASELAGSPSPSPPPEAEAPVSPARAEVPASAAPSEGEPPSEAAAQGARTKLLRWALGLALGALLLFALTPTILSQGIMSAILRSQLGAEVGPVTLSWTGGLSIQALQLEEAPTPQAGGYAFWCREATLETSLVGGSLAAATGGEVRGGLRLRGAGLRLELGGSAPETATTPAGEDPQAPEAAATPAPEAESGDALPCGLDLTFDLDGFDVHLRDKGVPLLILEGLSGKASLRVARDGSLRATAPLVLTLEALRYPLGDPSNPWDGRIELRKAELRLERFVLPGASGSFELEGTLSAPDLHIAGLEFRSALLSAKSDAGRVDLTLVGKHPGTAGTLRFASRVESSNASAWPVDLDLELREVPVRGLAADFAPCLLPLLHSANARDGRFPPFSLQAKGDFKLIFGEDGIQGQATLDTMDAKGQVGLSPGELDASLLLRGYTAALTRLEVGGLLAGVLPRSLAFEGGESPFEINGENLRLHAFPLRSKYLDLKCSAEVGMASGDYRVGLRGRGRGEVPEAARAVLASLDRAGGVSLLGNLYGDDVPAAELPSRDVLLRAIQEEGAGAVWSERGGPLLEGAGGLLRGLPR